MADTTNMPSLSASGDVIIACSTSNIGLDAVCLACWYADALSRAFRSCSLSQRLGVIRYGFSQY